MNKELIKLEVSDIQKESWYKNGYLICSRGDGVGSRICERKKFWKELDEVDIVLLAYFADRGYHGNEACRWKTEFFNENIWKGPLYFILPYMYDDRELDVFHYGWERIENLVVFWCDEEGKRFKVSLPKITDIFYDIDELVEYVKEEIKKIRPDISEEEGVLVRPWEIDEAREVLKQAGWDEQELRYLRWVGNDRAFGACIEVSQKFADYMRKKFDQNSKKDKIVLNSILDALRIANQKCDRLYWNGPQGMCGTYIYRSSEKILQNLDWKPDEGSIVRMPDGRVYILREGD